ncbi:hypothetical protein GEMRC1_010062 [Eukaryota sp. GEM-RC1]
MTSNFGHVKGQLTFPKAIENEPQCLVSGDSSAHPLITFPESQPNDQIVTTIPSLKTIHETFATHSFTPKTSKPLDQDTYTHDLPRAPSLPAIRPIDRYQELQDEVQEFQEYLKENQLTPLVDSTDELSKSLDDYARKYNITHYTKETSVLELDDIIQKLQDFSQSESFSFNCFSESSLLTVEEAVHNLEQLIGPSYLLPKGESLLGVVADLKKTADVISLDKVKRYNSELKKTVYSLDEESKNEILDISQKNSELIQYLYSHLTKFEKLRDSVPFLIERLNSLKDCHLKAQDMIESFDDLKNQQKMLEKTVQNQNKVIEELRETLLSNAKIIKQKFG